MNFVTERTRRVCFSVSRFVVRGKKPLHILCVCDAVCVLCRETLAISRQFLSQSHFLKCLACYCFLTSGWKLISLWIELIRNFHRIELNRNFHLLFILFIHIYIYTLYILYSVKLMDEWNMKKVQVKHKNFKNTFDTVFKYKHRICMHSVAMLLSRII